MHNAINVMEYVSKLDRVPKAGTSIGKLMASQRGLFVGSQADFEAIHKDNPDLKDWAIVHACKVPHHKEMVGYTTSGAPKDHPDYLFKLEGNRLACNLVDVDDPDFIRPEIIDAALGFIDQYVRGEKPCNVLVHCNQGGSRAPTIAMLYLGMRGELPPADFEFAEAEFKRQFYPAYNPARGMREFAKANWQRYTQKEAA